MLLRDVFPPALHQGLEAMSGAVEEKAVVALEALYSAPLQERKLAQAREIFALLRANGQV